MIKTFTHSWTSFHSRAILLFLASVLSLSASAQSQQQKKAIKAQSRLVLLQRTQQLVTPSEEQRKLIRRRAQRLKLPLDTVVAGRSVRLDGFWPDGRPRYLATFSRASAQLMHTADLWQGNSIYDLEGEGITLFQWDGGMPLASHREFGGRVMAMEPNIEAIDHSTSVASTMVASGVDPRAHGMAPRALLKAYDWDNDLYEIAGVMADGNLLANASYGALCGWVFGDYGPGPGYYWVGLDSQTEDPAFGAYTERDQLFDQLTLLSPYYLHVLAAGNANGDGPGPRDDRYVFDTVKQRWVASTKERSRNGGEHGFDCIPTGSLSKNALVVGAVSKENALGGTWAQADFSSTGPTNDGRIKPDISAIGTNVFMATSYGDKAYGFNGGTSFAAPIVTGSLGLLQEFYSRRNQGQFMRAATLRALVIGTAEEAGDAAGPDYKMGWGILNTLAAANAIADDLKRSLILEETLAEGQGFEKKVTARGGEPLRVTIAWADAASDKLTSLDEVNDRTAMLVNDLDLRIIAPDGVTLLPWHLDVNNPAAPATRADNNVDNVEQVVVDNPIAGGQYTIRITHKGQLLTSQIEEEGGDGDAYHVSLVPVESQDFSLVATGIDAVGSDVGIVALKPGVDPDGFTASTPVTVEVANMGHEAVGQVVVNLTVEAEDADIAAQTLRSETFGLAVGEKKTLTFMADLSMGFVRFKLKATVEAAADEVVSNNFAALTTMGTAVDMCPPAAECLFDFEKPLDQSGWTVVDVNGDKSTWTTESNTLMAYNGEGYALNYPNFTRGASDWLISCPVRVNPGQTYRLSFWSRRFDKAAEQLLVALGTEAKPASMTKQLAKVNVESDKKYGRTVVAFTPESNLVYIGFNHADGGRGKAFAVGLDDIRLEHAASKPDPAFETNDRKVSRYDDVHLVNTTYSDPSHPVTRWEWSFSPSTVTFVDGNAGSMSPTVRFTADGKYSITLVATNDMGSRTFTRTDYCEAYTQPIKADFEAAARVITAGEAVSLKNTTTGFPAADTYAWTVTPADGVAFENGGATVRDPLIRFSLPGKYTVAMTATGRSGSNTVTKQDFITVNDNHAMVRNLTGSLDAETGMVTLSWVKPLLQPIYKEDFEGYGAAGFPADIRVIDANNDGNTFKINTQQAYEGRAALCCYNYDFNAREAVDMDDWAVLPKMPAGAEELKLAMKKGYERFDVYVVEADGDRQPTAGDLEKGHKILSGDGDDTSWDWSSQTIDLAPYTSKDFYVAFHHRSTAKDAYALGFMVDDVTIGYRDELAVASSAKAGRHGNHAAIPTTLSEKLIFHMEKAKGHGATAQRFEKAAVKAVRSMADNPVLIGYDVKHGGSTIFTTNDIHATRYQVTHSGEDGRYYVAALYADGHRSEAAMVDVVATGMAALPEKSALRWEQTGSRKYRVSVEGRVIEKLEIWNPEGQKVCQLSPGAEEAQADLTALVSGVYVIRITTDQGAAIVFKQTVR